MTSKKTWGGWYVAGKDLVLDVPGHKEIYWIPLSQISEAPHGWTWLHQLASKRWATPSIVAGLANAMADNGFAVPAELRSEAMGMVTQRTLGVNP